MSALAEHVAAKALRLGVPLCVHLDLTWRCNLHCQHCYLVAREGPELDEQEVRRLLAELAGCGALFLCLSGGEPLLRADLPDLIKYARTLAFSVTLKTNGTLLDDSVAQRLARAHVAEVHLSLYSHRAQVHDAVTGVPGSLERTLAAARRLVRAGVKVRIVNVLMRQNAADYPGVRKLAAELGVQYAVDPTITPRFDGDFSLTALSAPSPVLREIFANPELAPPVSENCPPHAPQIALDSLPCSAGHTSCYVSPFGDVYPCVQFPMRAGNVRERPFDEIWRGSEKLRELRAVSMNELPVCRACPQAALCTRCPGLAYMQGDLRGPSLLDGEKVMARTGVRPPCIKP